MTGETRLAVADHIRTLEARAIAGDLDAVRSLACMALIKGDGPDDDPPDEAPEGEEVNVVDLVVWRRAA